MNEKTGKEIEMISTIPLYAQGPYDRELNYKLWSTYKSRFNAAERLKRKHELSTWAVAMLSAYVTIFSQITVMLPQFSHGSTGQTIVFISSALSILILVISQLESSQNYSVRAHTFHQSGLLIAELYKELRASKTRYGGERSEAFLSEVEGISKRYDDILQRSDNHDGIDFALFRASKPDYEDHAMSKSEVRSVHWRCYFREYCFYHLCMVVPPVLFGLYAWYSVSRG